MCETCSSIIKRYPDMSKIALKGQFYVIIIGRGGKILPNNDNTTILEN